MAGTISRGIKAPIIREGDDIVKIVADSVLAAVEQDGFQLHERDVICVTEAVVARADGNYASTEDIAADVKAKLGGETVGVVFPILSRNRFAICLRGASALSALRVVKGLAQHLVTTAHAQHRCAGSCQLLHGTFQSALPQPEQIVYGVFCTRQNDHIWCAQLPGALHIPHAQQRVRPSTAAT